MRDVASGARGRTIEPVAKLIETGWADAVSEAGEDHRLRGTMTDDESGRARLRCRLGGVLALLDRRSLLDEERPCSLVARTADQSGDRCRRDPSDPCGGVSRPSQHRSVARRRRARPLRFGVGICGLGPTAHRTQLGTPMTQKDEPELVTSGPYQARTPPHLLGHPDRGYRAQRSR